MGTILDVSAPVGVHYSHVGAKFGLHVSPELLNENFKILWRNMKNKHPNYGRHSGLGSKNWWKLLVHETFISSSQRTIDSVTLNNISHYLFEMYNHPEQWKCCDGAVDFIKHVYGKQIPMGVVSNFDERLEGLLQNMGLRKYFAFVIGSYDVGVEKPDPRIFNLVEVRARSIKGLSDIKKGEILHIGDTPDLDVIPAINAGWKAVLISKSRRDSIMKYPNIDEGTIFRDLHELKQVFT